MQTKPLTTHVRVCVAGAALALAMPVLAGCGGQDKKAAGPTKSPATDAPEAKPAEPVTSGAFRADHRYDWRVATNGDASDRGPNGFAASLTVQFAEPVEPGEPLPEGFAPLESVCDVDEASDLLVPMRISVKNMAEFPGGIESALAFAQGRTGTNDLNVSGAVKYSDGPSCKTDVLDVRSTNDAGRPGPSMINFWSTVAPGESKRANWLLVITDYRGNEFPEGNDEAFNVLRASATATLEYEGERYTFHPDCFTGRPPVRAYNFSLGFLGFTPDMALAPGQEDTSSSPERCDTNGG